jgi:hypothetical protein
MHPLRLRFTLPAAVLVALVLGVVLAGRGGAAGVNICPATGPACLTAQLLPGQLRVGSDGVVIARFQNQASSNASHTVISVTLPAGTTPISITSSPAATCTLATLSCSFGSVAGKGVAKVFVRFTVTSSSGNAIAGATLTFDEGNGTSPTTDTVTAQSNAGVFNAGTTTGVNGKCTSSGSSLAAFSAGESISATYPAALASLNLPCTPVDTGVGGTIPGFTKNVVFVDLPLLSGNGLATLTIVFDTLPPGVNNVNQARLYEVPPTGSPFLVPDCVAGALPAGADACVNGKKKSGSSGVQFTVLAKGLGGDPKFNM